MKNYNRKKVALIISCSFFLFSFGYSAFGKDTYGQYDVYIGSKNNKVIIKTTNSNQSVDDIISLNISEKSRPAFVSGLAVPPPTSSVIAPGSFPVDYEITFDISNDYQSYVGQSGTIELQWTADNEDCMLDWPGKNPKPWDVDIQLNVVDLFTAICSPPSQTINNGETKSHTVTVTNLHNEEAVGFHVSVNGGGAGWSISGGGWSFAVPANSSHSESFSVTNSGAASDLIITIEVTAVDYGITKTPENLDGAENPGHVTDHPDDNFSVSSPEYPTDWLYDSESKIGVFASGWGEGFHYLLGKFQVATTIVKQDFTILNEPGRSVNDLDVLLVGSAGLAGLESSPSFREKLADYVAQGGVLVVYTAKNGYEFNALPGGEVAGYGWDEDQSCLHSAVSIETYHQILSGQSSTNLTVNIDGYFTKWPANATILLQRNKNGMPAMIMYPFGEGQVIAATAFTDWGYGHNQSTEQGQRLLRDIVAWAQAAKQLPEFSPGSNVDFSFDMTNSSATHTSQVKLVTLDPNRNIAHEEVVSLDVPAGETESYSYHYSSIPSNLGIWYVYYTLLDGDGNPISDEQLGEYFVVSDPVEVAVKPALTFGVNSDAEYYAHGSEGVFSIHLWNHSDVPRTITFYYFFPHNIWQSNNHELYGTCSWGSQSSNLNETVEIPPHDEYTFTYSVPLISWDRLWVVFFDENDKLINTSSRGFYTYNPSCEIQAATEKSEYKGNDEVALTLHLKNKQSHSYTAGVNILVLNPDNVRVWEENLSVPLGANETVTENVSFNLPASVISGAYTIRISADNNGNKVGSYTAHFIVPEAYLALTPVLPGVFHHGDNDISFKVENVGLVGVSSGNLELILKDPQSATAWTESKGFDLSGEDRIVLDFTMPIEEIYFGNYHLVYQAHYNGLSTKPATKIVPSTCNISLVNDKSFYRIRETMGIEVAITNNGRFQYDEIEYAISIASLDSRTGTVTLSPNQNIQEAISMEIPSDWSAGTYEESVILTLPSGSFLTKTYRITIPQSEILMNLENSIFNAGDLVPLQIKNNGGMDTDVDYVIQILDNQGTAIFSQENAITLMAGEETEVECPIPSDAAEGTYRFDPIAVNKSTNDTTRLYEILSISGVKAEIAVQTDKQVYIESEPKTAMADISVTSGNIEGGNLSLNVLHLAENSKGWTTLEDWETGELNNVDITTSPGDVIAEVSTGSPSNGSQDNLFCIIKDSDAWRVKANEIVIQEKGFNYNVISSNMLASWDFLANGNKIIIIVSDQRPDTYQNIYANRDKIAEFVANGGVLLAHSSDVGWNGWRNARNYEQFRPGEESRIIDGAHDLLEIVDINHPLFNGITDDMLDWWNNPAYGYFTNLMEGTNVLIDDDGLPMYIEYKHGFGTVLATMQVIEWPFASSFGTQQLLRNEIDYALTLLKQCSVVLKFDAGRIVEWNTAEWVSTESDQSHIKILTRTANSDIDLPSAAWSHYLETSGATITSPPGRWLEAKVIFETPDPETNPCILHDFSIKYVGKQNVWTRDFSLNSDETQHISLLIEPFSGPGKFSLEGITFNSLNQEITRDEYPFFIGDAQVYLVFETDKEVYKPGENVHVTGKVLNRSEEDIINAPILFKVNETDVFNEHISITAGSEYPFSFDMNALNQHFYLSGVFNDLESKIFIEVDDPDLLVDVIAPDIVGHKPFEVIVKLINTRRVDVNITATIQGETEEVSIAPGQTKITRKEITTLDDISFNVFITGDVEKTMSKDIKFGEDIEGDITVEAIYPEGIVTLPYFLTNTGLLDVNLEVSLILNGQTYTREYFITVGQTINDDISFNLTAGEYTLEAVSIYGGGTYNFVVARADQLNMDLTVSRYAAPRVLLLRDGSSDEIFNENLLNEGMDVTMSEVLFHQWDGTNPDTNGFDVIFLPCAEEYVTLMSDHGQNTLVEFVSNGGGFITTEWITYGVLYYNNFSQMSDLLLFEPSQWNYYYGEETFTVLEEHPLTKGLPSSFFVPFHYTNSGGLKPGATAIVSGTITPNIVAVKQYGEGRIAQFAINAWNLGELSGTDANIGQLLVNAINWTGKSSEGNNIIAKLTIENQGHNDFDGQLSLSTDFYVKTEDQLLLSGENYKFNYALDITDVTPGIYSLKAEAKRGGNIIQHTSQEFEIAGPQFTLSTFPENPIFTPGEQIPMTFGIKNTGMAEGETEYRLQFLDLYDESRRAWIAPGMEKTEIYSFQIPDDMPEGEYTAEFSLSDTVLEIPFTIVGVRIAVEASLDKSLYTLGETAILTLDITNENPSLTPDMYARAISNGDEDRVDFTLADNQSLQLSLPVNETTLNRIAYGIYLSSGRAVYLNTIFIRIMKGIITIYTEKDVYNLGETVLANVETAESGPLVITTSTGFETELDITGATSFSFELPDELVSGTNTINYIFNDIHTGVCYFDVQGYSLKMNEVTLDQSVYEPIDNMTVNFSIQSNVAISTVLKGWLYTPTNTYTELFEITSDCSEGENKVAVNTSFSTGVAGLHKIVYGLYKIGSNLTLVTGAEAFDVKPAAVLSVATDKDIYSETDNINATIRTIACKEFSGTLDLILNGTVVESRDVTLTGDEEHSFTIDPLVPWKYTLVAQLHTDKLMSEKEIEFAVLDLAAPAKPLGLTISVEGPISILDWNDNGEPDLHGYIVFRNTTKLTNVPLKSSNFRDEGLVSGVEYIYSVTAVDKSGNESEPSDEVAVVLDNKAPEITMSPSSDIISNKPVTLTYSVIDDLDESPQVTANYPSPTSFISDGVYEVSILAEDDQGNRTSKSVSITIETGAPPQVADLLAIDAELGSTVNLQWFDYNPPNDLQAFRVYVAEVMLTDVTDLEPVISLASEVFEYQVTGLDNGDRYFFAVVPVDNANNANTSVVTATAIPTRGKGSVTLSSTPENVKVYIGGNYGYLGKNAGTTPITITDLKEGNYIFQCVLPGYNTYYQLVEVLPSLNTTVDANLVGSVEIAFETGVTIQDENGDLDVGSNSTPFVIDWDMDGLKDLIIGNSDGNIYYYQNAGTDAIPLYTTGTEILSSMGSFLSVYVVDWNNDNQKDIIVGNENGYIDLYINYGTESNPVFSNTVTLPDMQVAGSAIPCVIDWNNDQKKDLLIGAASGEICLYLNTGTDEDPSFNSEPDLTPVNLGIGNAAPFVVTDWDRDGDKDMVVGDAEGYLNLHLNIGTDENPLFDLGERIDAAGNDIQVGTYAKPFVVDYNNDGMMDLIIGNSQGTVLLYLASEYISLSPPLGVRARAKTSKVGLSWQAVENATSYNIYREDFGDTPLGSTTNLAYMDYNVVNGTTYTYTITALDENSNESSKSDPVSATPKRRPR